MPYYFIIYWSDLFLKAGLVSRIQKPEFAMRYVINIPKGRVIFSRFDSKFIKVHVTKFIITNNIEENILPPTSLNIFYNAFTTMMTKEGSKTT